MSESPLETPEPSKVAGSTVSPVATENVQPTERSVGAIWERIKQHKVVQWTLAYLALAYTLLHGAEMLGNSLGWSHGLLRLFTLILILGVPVVVVLAWYHGARGLQRASGTEIMIIATLLAVGGAILWRDSTTEHGSRATTASAVQSVSVPQAAAARDKNSIAVLPFVNMSSDKEQEFFADGISEELLNLLAQLPELRVIARTSSFSFKGKMVEIADIARTLGVAHVLEGSVRRSGDKVRISAQLIRASDSSHLWSHTYDRQMTDVFEVQDQIAAAVVAELKMRLSGAAPKAKITDPKAYTLFLQARAIGRQITTASLEQSNRLYREALDLDPRYAAAWAWLASNYCSQAAYGLAPTDQSIGLAREATHKALAVEPDLADAHSLLGWIAQAYDVDLSMAAQHLADALALEPANPDVLLDASVLLRRLGRLDEAIAIGKYQVGLDPINPSGHEMLAASYSDTGRPDDAFAELRTMLSLSPNHIGGHFSMGRALLQKGDAKLALAEMQQEVLDGVRLIGLSLAHHALGHKSESNAALAELIERYAEAYPSDIASIFAFRGEADRAFEWLDKAALNHDLLLSSVAGEPMFANIHADPRWLPFLRKHGLAPEQLAAIKFDVSVPE
jgi:TolB-like protein